LSLTRQYGRSSDRQTSGPSGVGSLRPPSRRRAGRAHLLNIVTLGDCADRRSWRRVPALTALGFLTASLSRGSNLTGPACGIEVAFFQGELAHAARRLDCPSVARRPLKRCVTSRPGDARR
jgi:hypothetical protein